jgi:hypothetical protein
MADFDVGAHNFMMNTLNNMGGGNPYAGSGMGEGLKSVLPEFPSPERMQDRTQILLPGGKIFKSLMEAGAIVRMADLQGLSITNNIAPPPTPFAGNIAGVFSSKSR